MKVNGIKFVYRGTDYTGLGQALASLLEEVSVEYTIASANPNTDNTHVSADLGALLQTLDEKVITRKNEYAIQTTIPTVRVRDRNVLQWLRAMNIPIGKPITLQFEDDLSFDWSPDTTKDQRNGKII